MAAVVVRAAAPIVINDIQVGERGSQTRIALVCSAPCIAEKKDNQQFLLPGVEATIDLDLTARSALVSSMSIARNGASALLKIEPVENLEFANAKSCKILERDATCIDLFFDLERVENASQKPLTPPKARTDVSVDAAPGLREVAPDRMQTFAKLAAPERLEPPSGAILAKVQPIEETVKIAAPAVLIGEPAPLVSDVDFKSRVRNILGKDLTVAFCNNADAALQTDAWALGAMADLGLCAASRGDVEEADAILARLLEYTPDNYEALVGRALIAAQAEERSVARKFFQDALNALPPIDESNRIVEAMARL